jgi:hypothetical protein
MSDFLADGAELFATSRVRDYEVAYPWWERLLGGPPTFKAHETEAVWEVAPHRWVVVEERPERAGYGSFIYRDPDGNEIGFGGSPA